MPKLKEIRIAKGMQQKELARSIGADEPMLSRFETYKCLPVPKMLEKITQELGCTALDIYDPDEIYIKATAAKAKNKKASTTTYHLTADLPPQARGMLKDILPILGYKGVTDWVNDCFVVLLKRHEAITEKEKTSSPAGKQ